VTVAVIISVRSALCRAILLHHYQWMISVMLRTLTPQMSEKTIETIKQDEGLRLKPYKDSLGFWSIGYGRCLDTRGITQAEAFDMLCHDILECEEELSRTYSTYSQLDDLRKMILICMCYQLGIAGLMGFRKMLGALTRGNYKLAAEEMRNSKWASQTFNRAHRLAHLMETGVLK
jgi:lysozyme